MANNDAFAGLSGKPDLKLLTLNSVLTFGKYQGMTVEDVCDLDPNYMDWVRENVTRFEIDTEVDKYLNGGLSALHFDDEDR